MRTKVDLKDNERIDDLIIGNLQIIQNPQLFCFSLDAVLLGNFVNLRPGEKVLDMGTGNGVIPLLLSAKGKAKKITGLEIQEPVAEMAKRSVILNNLEDKIEVLQGDLKDAPGSMGAGAFDVITCNPPYRPIGLGEVNRYDAHAIARHEIMCNLEDVINAASKWLKYHGRFYMVHRPDRLVDALYLMRAAKLEPKKLRIIYPKVGRKPNIFLVEAMHGGNASLEVMEPLYVYDDEGKHTEEIRGIYGGHFGAGEK